MNSNKESIWIAAMTSILACLFLPSMLYGQNPGGIGQVATPAKSEAQAAVKQDPDARGHDNSYVIGNDDMLAINVWKEAEISRSVPVRSDGKISLPLAGELQAAGRTPFKLEQDIAERLKNYISEPEVTVIVQQINSQKFNIMGQVVKPGSYPLASAATVLDAIAVAGGFRDFAKKKSIYVLRQNPDGTQTRIPFNYKEVIKGQNPSQNEKLQPRDTVVVP
ncbi:MAG TPA: polysaccharide biosynthesis/export family protein [Candidatus Solibacter sp.]|nr:polysaccharide biosynthesis/export family protein [Candidatus Solibacter sp.]